MMVRADAAIRAEPKENAEGTDISPGFWKRVRGWVWPGLRWNSARMREPRQDQHR